MGAYVVSQLVKAMLKKRIHVEGARVLIMGLTFKENCPDLRNTKIIDVVRELGEYNIEVDVYDPWVSAEEAKRVYGLNPISEPQPGAYDGIVLAVSHQQFITMSEQDYRQLGKPKHVLYDLKYLLPEGQSDLRL